MMGGLNDRSTIRWNEAHRSIAHGSTSLLTTPSYHHRDRASRAQEGGQRQEARGPRGALGPGSDGRGRRRNEGDAVN